MLRSLLRISIAVVVVSILGLLALTAALRQPTLTSLPFHGTTRADARLLREHVTFLTTDVRPRSVHHPENLERAAAYIAEHFRRAGGETELQSFETRGKRYANVVARFGPRDEHAAPLVVGAHYDAFAETGDLPGADDNASGTAGLLELARLLRGRQLRRPVLLVAYTNEEPPFFGSDGMGSAVHAERLAASGRDVRGMICLEMIGYFAKTQSWPNGLFALMYPSKGDFIAVAGGWSDRALARHVKRGIAGAGADSEDPLRAVSFSGPRETSDASDQRNYWAHGWPAVVVTDTAFLRNPHYHTAGDTAATLDYRRMAGVVDGVFSAVLHLP